MRIGPTHRNVPGSGLIRQEMITDRAVIRKGRLIACAAVCFLIQVTILHRLTYGILSVDLICILAVFLALEASESGALWSALGLGLLRDMGTSGRIGGSSVLLVLGAAGLVRVRDRIFRETPLPDMLLAFLFALFCGGGHAMAAVLAERYADWQALLSQAFGQAVVTAALYPFIALICDRIGLLQRQESGLA